MSRATRAPVWPLRRRRRSRAAHRPLAEVLARPATAGAYPGYRPPEDESQARRFLAGSALLHATFLALLLLVARLAPEIEPRLIELTLLQEEPPPIVEPPPPPPPPVAKPEPPPIAVPVPAPPPKPVPVAPPPEPVVAKPEPVAPPKPAPQIDQIDVPKPTPSAPSPARRRLETASTAVDPAPAVAIDGLDTRPRPQLDQVRRGPPPVAVATSRTTRPEAPDLGPTPVLAAPPALAAAPALRSGPARPEPVARRAPPVAPVAQPAAPRPVMAAPAAPAPPPPRPIVQRAQTARPKPEPVLRTASTAPPSRIPGVSLGSLAPCLTDARELALKQRVVAAAGDRASCESASGRFHFIETKNVNAFLMGIERAPSRRSGDRCEELTYALDCLANSPRRSRP